MGTGFDGNEVKSCMLPTSLTRKTSVGFLTWQETGDLRSSVKKKTVKYRKQCIFFH